MSQVTAHDMIEMLRRHYIPDGKPPGGIFAPEIQAPGTTGRRADLIWQGHTAAAGNQLIGHEVKVSRADLLAELSDLTKSDPWQKYCDRWWLVVSDVALTEGLDLPPTWGVLAPPSGRRTRTMTVVVPAPKLSPHEQAPALRTLAAWVNWRRYDQQAKLGSLQRDLTRANEDRDRLRKLVPAAPGSTVSKERALVHDIIQALGGLRYGEERIGTWDSVVSKEDVVAALKDLGSVKGRVEEATHTLNRLRDQLRYLSEAAGRAHKESA